MKNKVIIISFILITLLTLTACTKQKIKNEEAIRFKEEYESLNEISHNGRIYRNVSIDINNPFVYITAEELIEKMDKGETLYVYFGSKFCPWCRSIIEKFIDVAKDNGISKVYYIDIWDDEGNEILRDKYIIDSNNQIKKSINGTAAYHELLKRFDSILLDYTLVDKNDEEINIGEKRIYAPSFIYIKNGVAEDLVEGISDKQTSSNQELTKEILEDEAKIFNEFFEKNCGC